MFVSFILLKLIFSVAAHGFFGITYPTYSSFILDEATTVGIIRMLPYPRTGDSAIMKRHNIKCSRFCALNAKCGSSYAALHASGIFVRCFLLPSNLCTNQRLDLAPSPNTGAQLYDKILDSIPSQSCIEICMLNNPGNCSVCQRPGCTGLRCETCSTTCLQCYNYMYPGLSLQENAECNLWLGGGNLYKQTVNCLGSKALLFQRFNYPNGTSVGWNEFAFDTCAKLSTTKKFLYIELFSNNFAWPSYTTTYAGFSCFTNKSIALESLVNGTDGLGAPILSSVPFVEDENSYNISCGSFWLLNASNFNVIPKHTPYGLGPCPGLSTAFFGTPSNSTLDTFRSGIAWAGLPNISLIGVKVYMY